MVLGEPSAVSVGTGPPPYVARYTSPFGATESLALTPGLATLPVYAWEHTVVVRPDHLRHQIVKVELDLLGKRLKPTLQRLQRRNRPRTGIPQHLGVLRDDIGFVTASDEHSVKAFITS